MDRARVMAALVGLSLAVAFAAPAMPGPGLNNKYPTSEVTIECRDGNGNKVGEIVYDGPLQLWPPNHKYQTVSVTATAEDPDDGVTLDTEGSHNEFAEDGTEFNGAGNTDADVNPPAASDGPNSTSATTSHDIRSERSGMGDGRVYTIDWQATFTDDDADQGYVEATCASAGFDGNEDAFEIAVPHDQRCGAGWKDLPSHGTCGA